MRGRRLAFWPRLDVLAPKKELGCPSPCTLPALRLPEVRVLLEQEPRPRQRAGRVVALTPAAVGKAGPSSPPPRAAGTSGDTSREAGRQPLER